mmetsp:Transcript_15644/g.46378  ORF Transcript_15644/g.46378 Transcript_15644/m.46378 type:complete len:430 (+) Transcript_15644:641-1930(+)
MHVKVLLHPQLPLLSDDHFTRRVGVSAPRLVSVLRHPQQRLGHPATGADVWEPDGGTIQDRWVHHGVDDSDDALASVRAEAGDGEHLVGDHVDVDLKEATLGHPLRQQIEDPTDVAHPLVDAHLGRGDTVRRVLTPAALHPKDRSALRQWHRGLEQDGVLALGESAVLAGLADHLDLLRDKLVNPTGRPACVCRHRHHHGVRECAVLRQLVCRELVVVRAVHKERPWLLVRELARVVREAQRVERADRRPAVLVHQPAQIDGVAGRHGLPDQPVQSQLTREHELAPRIIREELGVHVQVRVDPPSGVEQPLRHVERGRVRVVDPDAIEEPRGPLGVLGHVVPQPRVVGRARAKSQLDRVAPGVDLAAEVRPRAGRRKVDPGVGPPDPTVARHQAVAHETFNLGLPRVKRCREPAVQPHKVDRQQRVRCA